jgi:hypothetical protein
MSRSNGAAEACPPQTAEVTPPPTRTIDDNAVHPLAEWGRILGLPPNCLKREARLKRLRVSRRAGKLWALGSWVRQWIEGGEVRRGPAGEGEH